MNTSVHCWFVAVQTENSTCARRPHGVPTWVVNASFELILVDPELCRSYRVQFLQPLGLTSRILCCRGISRISTTHCHTLPHIHIWSHMIVEICSIDTKSSGIRTAPTQTNVDLCLECLNSVWWLQPFWGDTVAYSAYAPYLGWGSVGRFI